MLSGVLFKTGSLTIQFNLSYNILLVSVKLIDGAEFETHSSIQNIQYKAMEFCAEAYRKTIW